MVCCCGQLSSSGYLNNEESKPTSFIYVPTANHGPTYQGIVQTFSEELPSPRTCSTHVVGPRGLEKCTNYRRLSVDHAQRECRLLTFKPRKPAKFWRRDIVVDLVEITVIRQVNDVKTQANFVRSTVVDEGNAEVPIDLAVNRKKGREPLAIGNPNVVL